jgi:hypothetical protein
MDRLKGKLEEAQESLDAMPPWRVLSRQVLKNRIADLNSRMRGQEDMVELRKQLADAQAKREGKAGWQVISKSVVNATIADLEKRIRVQEDKDKAASETEARSAREAAEAEAAEANTARAAAEAEAAEAKSAREAAAAEAIKKAVPEYLAARTAYNNERREEATNNLVGFYAGWGELKRIATLFNDDTAEHRHYTREANILVSEAEERLKKTVMLLQEEPDDGAITAAASMLVEGSLVVPEEYVNSLEKDIAIFSKMLAKRKEVYAEVMETSEEASDDPNVEIFFKSCEFADFIKKRENIDQRIDDVIKNIDLFIMNYDKLVNIPAEPAYDYDYPASSPRQKSQATDTIRISDHIQVLRHDGGYTDIEIYGKLYPVIYARGGAQFNRPAIGVPATMPTQATGVCYFHAAMHVIMNNEVFVHSLLKHLENQIEASRYARTRYESYLQAQNKRGLNITMSRMYDLAGEGVRPVWEATTIRPGLYMFARNVLLRQTILTALERKGFDETGNKNLDTRTVFMLKSLPSISRGMYDSLVESVDGGEPTKALIKILELSSAQVASKFSPDKKEADYVVSRIPDGSTLVIVSRSLSPNISAFRELPPDMGESFGGFDFFLPRNKLQDGFSGHALSYQRDDKQFKYVDSNDAGTRNPSGRDLMKSYELDDETTFRFITYYPSYTIKLAEWPFEDKQRGGDPAAVDTEELELLTPADVNVLSTCDSETCSVPDDVRFAVEVTRLFAEQEEQQSGGSPSAAPYGQWLALAGVVVAMALCPA